jgi:5-methyltetrahydrofolate--homocysteine methyltransferase
MTSEILFGIKASLIEGDPDVTVTLTKSALQAGVEPLSIVDEALVPGMREVGDRYSCGEFFLPNLVIAAGAMKKAMELIEPELRARHQQAKSRGIVIIGTVRGDIHEIGKSLVATMLAANGFEVHDLGVDVPVEKFVEAARSTGAHLVGISALLTTTMIMQKKVIEALAAAGVRPRLKIMVGGAPVTRKWAEDIGADGYAEDVVGAIDLASKLLQTA